jgi:hypothetical protein
MSQACAASAGWRRVGIYGSCAARRPTQVLRDPQPAFEFKLQVYSDLGESAKNKKGLIDAP